MKTTYILEGLDCANCGMKIEQRAKNISGVSNSSLVFVNKRLELEHDGTKKSEVEKSLIEIVKKLEPDVNVKEVTNEGTGSETHEVKKGGFLPNIIRFGAALTLLILSIAFSGKVSVVMAWSAFLLAGWDVLVSAVRNIIKREPFDETLLMTIATIGAICIGEVSEGAAVMVFFQIGELFQSIAVERSRKSITALMKIKPEFVRIIKGGKEQEISPEAVKLGDIFVVRPGERIACDGVITSGEAVLDTAAVTGESVPCNVSVGDKLISGSVNQNGRIEAECTAEYKNSTIAKILEMVENASSRKANAEKFITKFARVYTPIVVFVALLLSVVPPLFMGFSTFSDWLYRGLIFLVISCPCALVISVPLSFFAGIGGAAASGVLIKGAFAIESISKITAIGLDKTGTITKGSFKVTRVESFNEFSENEILRMAAIVESGSNHPIAKSISNACRIEAAELEQFTEYAGKGASAQVDGKNILVGNKRLMEDKNIEISDGSDSSTTVYLAVDGILQGMIILDDELKGNAKSLANRLKSQGVERIVMLTGDKAQAADKVGEMVGIEEIKSELLPQMKVDAVEKLCMENKSGTTAFCGDGINDAPVLARADIGFAMGGLGSDVAIEAADAVIMNDDPAKLATAIKLSKRTMGIVRQNIIIALGIKFCVLILGAIGEATMWEAVYADVGVSILAILNSLRAMKKMD